MTSLVIHWNAMDSGMRPSSSMNLSRRASASLSPTLQEEVVGTRLGSKAWKFLPVGSTSSLPLVIYPEGPGLVYPPARAFSRAPISSDPSMRYDMSAILAAGASSLFHASKPRDSPISSVVLPLRTISITLSPRPSIHSAAAPLLVPVSLQKPEGSERRVS